ncbi:MAG: phosphoribosylglycinamide formyltransferase [Deltaproteobacteria bacterium]|nr:MAG: phosphoribosylglycinamide formyltransferase [Deltaproteobacteria bacterium]
MRCDKVEARAKRLKLAVLISGGGSNLQAMIDQAEAGRLHAQIVLVVSSNPEAYGLTRAQNHGIKTAVVDYGKYGRKNLPTITRSSLPDHFGDLVERQRIYSGLPAHRLEDRLARLVLAEQEIVGLLEPLNPDLVCLAGFMRLLSPFFIEHYCGEGTYRVMNIHPALLPAFPGSHGYEDTFSYGCRFGGITVHFVDEGEDTGPIIAQAVYPIWPEDTLDLVKKRGLELEYALYSQCIQWMAQGDLLVEKAEDGRPRVLILDPDYPRFMEQLTQQSFARNPI